MPLSSPQKYGRVAIVLHWAIALFVLLAFVSGLVAEEAGILAPVRAHVFFGLSATVLTVLRILWWLAVDRRPQHGGSAGAQLDLLARIVHVLLYVIPLGMLGSGMAMVVGTGSLGPILSGTLATLPDFEALPLLGPHGLFAWVLIGLAALHIIGALYHQFVLRDGLLARLAWRQRR